MSCKFNVALIVVWQVACGSLTTSFLALSFFVEGEDDFFFFFLPLLLVGMVEYDQVLLTLMYLSKPSLLFACSWIEDPFALLIY